MAESDLDTKLSRRSTSGRNRSKKSERRRSSRRYGLPAPVVFWIVAPLGVAGVIMPVIEDVQWVALTFSAIVVQIGVLLINDRYGFIRSREMRRAYEARRHFAILETIVLFLLVMADMLAAAYALLMAAMP